MKGKVLIQIIFELNFFHVFYRNQLSEKAYYKNLYHEGDEDDDFAENDEFNEVMQENNYNDYSSPNEVSEDSIDDDDDSLNDDSESESEVLLNEELMNLSLDSFKALKEAVYEIDDKIKENQKSKRETHLGTTKRKFQEEDEDDQFEEVDEDIHKDNKRHDSCHCNKNCAAKNQDEGLIGKLGFMIL